MTREEMLKKLGLTQEENDELMNSLGRFLQSLTPNQRRVFKDLMPKPEDVARSFGPDVTIEDLQTLATPVALAGGVAFFAFVPPPPPPPGVRPGPPRKPEPPRK
jgi:hypothetical protein